MFTDDDTNPVRLEVLLDLLRHVQRGTQREDVYRMLQPRGLHEKGAYVQAKATVRAGLDLGMLEEDGGVVSMSAKYKKAKDVKCAILTAIDHSVLSKVDVEPYFALFYSYYLGLGKDVDTRRSQSKKDWADQFNREVFDDVKQSNPFNETKLNALHRWYGYVGLGWYDPGECFQANPYDRIRRNLGSLYGKKKRLEADEFMRLLSSVCPELDGGDVFTRANRGWNLSKKQCSLGLSHALIELHQDGILRLICPADSNGWSVDMAKPPRDEHIKSPKFVAVDLVGGI